MTHTVSKGCMNQSARIKLIIFFVAFLSATESSYPYVQSIAEGPVTATAVGAGGLSALPFTPLESLYQFPAHLQEYERKGVLLTGIYGDSVYGFGGTFFIPSSIGALGARFLYLRDNLPGKLTEYASLSLGFGKKITEKFTFGFFIKPSWGTGDGGAFFGLGFEPGVAYNTKSNIASSTGIGIYDFTFYAFLSNLSLNLGETEYAPRISFRGGTQLGIFRKGLFKTNLFTEGYGIGNFTSVPLHTGLELQYSFAQFRMGYMFSSESDTYQGLSLGTGIYFPFANGDFLLNYALLPDNDKRKETLHFLSLGGTFGKLDKTPPEASVILDNRAFSPNADGEKDYVNFSLKVTDDSPLQDWSLTIKDPRGNVVRIFENDKRGAQKSPGLGGYISRIFKSRESLVIPGAIRWDGTGEAISLEQANAENVVKRPDILPNGVYSWEFTVSDARNNINKGNRGTITLDTNPPKIDFEIQTPVFSPNGDGNLETLIIQQEGLGDVLDDFTGIITDEKNNVVRTWKWKEKIPARHIWDGLDDNGKPAPEGVYRYIITGQDEAGNSAKKTSGPITLVRRTDSVELAIYGNGLSPNGDTKFDTIKFKPVIGSEKGLKSWQILILNDKWKKGEKQTSLKDWQGNDIKSLPKEIVWDGKDNQGKILADAIYYIYLTTMYESGNNPVSITQSLTIDTTPPLVYASAELKLFSPDNDGENEEQIFKLKAEDMSGIQSYEFPIYEMQEDENGKRTRYLFRKFIGTETVPETIFWAGKNEQGQLVESATEYEFELFATDAFGNTGSGIKQSFETDILVLRTDRGLKIRLSNIEFDRGSPKIRKKTYPLLEKLVRILKQYPQYKIKVEGHTDSDGPEEYNLRLSENRAKSVMSFLIGNGIDSANIAYQGMGEVYPILANSTWYNKSKNRRVEFLLVK